MAHSRKRRVKTTTHAIPACVICGRRPGSTATCQYICSSAIVLFVSSYKRVRSLLLSLGRQRAYRLMPAHRRAVRTDVLVLFLEGLQKEAFSVSARHELEDLIVTLRPFAENRELLMLLFLKEKMGPPFREAVRTLGRSASQPLIGRFEAARKLQDVSEHLRSIIGVRDLSEETRHMVRGLHRETRKVILIARRMERAASRTNPKQAAPERAPSSEKAPPHSRVRRRHPSAKAPRCAA